MDKNGPLGRQKSRHLNEPEGNSTGRIFPETLLRDDFPFPRRDHSLDIGRVMSLHIPPGHSASRV